jgi:hypothetical protein
MPSPDRALRRMVMDLAGLHADDAKAVLDALDPAQRKKVEAFLQEFSPFVIGEAPVAAQPEIDRKRIARWLAARLEAHPGARMTEAARAALRAEAVRFFPATRDQSSRRTCAAS